MNDTVVGMVLIIDFLSTWDTYSLGHYPEWRRESTILGPQQVSLYRPCNNSLLIRYGVSWCIMISGSYDESGRLGKCGGFPFWVNNRRTPSFQTDSYECPKLHEAFTFPNLLAGMMHGHYAQHSNAQYPILCSWVWCCLKLWMVDMG